ncbi:transcriptional regulator PpsR [Pontivivens insulae]|uniref:PAS domain-containing protein n=1 Tax=Pontivivens insulae TaxID=1639689 RepID=A0A2R8AA74_9RHOB|nr:transcriptional regulator PpsR [Pontivivens insulae]RED12922.1 transcriptional regulator PpsR [Pontivivens insulae]SPF29015.1 hypothetical protein POI8812_01320 [Pontivivens insulae]
MTVTEEMRWNDGRGPSIDPNAVQSIVASACDICMSVDRAGKITGIAVGPHARSLGLLDHWVDRNLREFLTPESIDKFDRRMPQIEAGDRQGYRPIELNHADNASWEFPVRYAITDSGVNDELLLLGRDLRALAEVQQQLITAQMSLEREFETFQQTETRYRVLLEMTEQAVIFVNLETGRIVDLNGAAAHALHTDKKSLQNAAFDQVFNTSGRNALLGQLQSRSGASAPADWVRATIRRGSEDVLLGAVMFRAGSDRMLKVSIREIAPESGVAEQLDTSLRQLFTLGSDAVIFTDPRGVIRLANEAFLSLVDETQIGDVRGLFIADYLARGGIDQKVLLEHAERQGKMRVYTMRLSGKFGKETPVDVAAVALERGTPSGFGFVIRPTARTETLREAQPSPEGDRGVMELVGSSPLRDIVAETTDVIERLCIETALDLTNDNRVAAAEMLGLSRQSLYVKLRKFDLLKRADES